MVNSFTPIVPPNYISPEGDNYLQYYKFNLGVYYSL